MAIAVIAMLARRLYRNYMAFAVYMGLVFAVESVLFWMMFVSSNRGHKAAIVYWLIEWAAELVKGIFYVLVLADLYFQLFRDYEALRRFAKALFRSAAGVMFFVSALVAITAHSNIDWLTRLVLITDITATLFVCGFLIFLLALSGYFSLGWRHYATGIATGLAIQAPLMLAKLMLQLEFGYSIVPTTNVILRIAYAITFLVWLVYFVLPQPRTRTATALPNHTLAQWNQALLQYMR